MTSLEPPKFISKNIPKVSGVVQTSIAFIGTDKVFTFFDGLAGSPLQKIGVPIPLIGRISALDGFEIITIMAAAGKKHWPNVAIGWVVTKFFNAGVAGLPFIKSQVSTGSGSTQVSPAVVTTGQGAPVG